MTLPNFLIVGSQKCGTTSLHDILSQHPQANMSRIKEINFFTNESKYRRGLDFYSAFFDEPKQNQIITGESTPGYICHPGVAERIYKDLGVIKIVIILRDPIKRAFSQYWDNRRHLSESLCETQIVSNFLTDVYTPGVRGYFSRGVYMKYVERFDQIFGKNSLHIMLLEELMANPTSELRRLYDFLGIDKNLGLQILPPPSNSSMIWRNPFYKLVFHKPHLTKFIPMRMRRLFFFGKKEKYNYKLPEGETMSKLQAFYNPWNNQLSKYLDRELTNWLK